MRRRLAAWLVWSGACLAQQGDRIDADRDDVPAGLVVPPAMVRTAAEEAATFRLQPGFAAQLVASEPLLCDPVAATFDAAGHIWVVEMRSYMRDVDGQGEQTPDGRVVVLRDRDGDGAMDEVVPFLERLVLPRAVLPLPGGALVIAPPHLLWAVDQDGDLRAERTEVVAGGFDAGLHNPEHSGNGLLWGLDNLIHLAGDARLFRWTPAQQPPFAQVPGAGGGQWGISQDDRGRTWFNYNEDWLRCDLVPGRYAARGGETSTFAGLNHRVLPDGAVWPIRVTPGVNRGGRPGVLRDGVLARHTAACAPFVYRGDLLTGCAGDVFVCEPAAHVVRRVRLEQHDALVAGRNAHDKSEFMASSDERFRPVNLLAGPDGALYVVDMYRGVIQHRNFVTTFLRRQILGRGLQQPTGLGRIWRIVPADAEGRPAARPAPRLFAEASAAQLVAALAHRDGWQRDTAQQLLVQRPEPTAGPALRALLRRAELPVAKLHALSVLHAFSLLSHDDVRAAAQSDDPGGLSFLLQHAAPYLERGDRVLWAHCERLAESAPPCVRWHLALALGDVGGSQQGRARALLARLGAGDVGDAVLRGCVVASARRSEGLLVRELAPRLQDPRGAPLLAALAAQAGRSRDAGRQDDLLTAAAACMHSWQQAALLSGLCAALPAQAERQRGFFVFAATPPALFAMARTGVPEVQALVQRVLAATELRTEITAAPTESEPEPAERARLLAGARVYGAFCAACHQPEGRGMEGLAPPLRDSEWVTGSADSLIRIALHGVRGPLVAAGTSFDGEMPGQAHLRDEDLAAALSWLRRAWDHRGSPVAPADVAAVRTAHAGRTAPWPAAELQPPR